MTLFINRSGLLNMIGSFVGQREFLMLAKTPKALVGRCYTNSHLSHKLPTQSNPELSVSFICSHQTIPTTFNLKCPSTKPSGVPPLSTSTLTTKPNLTQGPSKLFLLATLQPKKVIGATAHKIITYMFPKMLIFLGHSILLPNFASGGE